MSRPTVIRRIGSVAIGAAVVALGLAAGLWFGSPAHADPAGTIQVRMPGDGGFSGLSTRPLLDVGDLGPGGSVGGTMQVRDNSDTTAGSGQIDSLVLTAQDVALGDHCPTTGAAAACAGSGAALARALRFDLTVTDPTTGATIRREAPTLGSLRSGVLLASGLAGGDVIAVRLTASLPFDTAGNDVSYGTVDFDLQLGLVTVAGESGQGGAPGGAHGPPGSGGAGGGHPAGTLVIGAGDLAFTGAPVVALVAAGAALLAAGLLLLLPGARRRRRRAAG